MDNDMPRRSQHFFRHLVADAKRRGELRAVDEPAVTSMIMALTLGLAQLAAMAGDTDELNRAVQAIERLFDGTLLVAPPR